MGIFQNIFPFKRYSMDGILKLHLKKNGEYSHRCDKSFSELFLVELVHQLAE